MYSMHIRKSWYERTCRQFPWTRFSSISSTIQNQFQCAVLPPFVLLLLFCLYTLKKKIKKKYVLVQNKQMMCIYIQGLDSFLCFNSREWNFTIVDFSAFKKYYYLFIFFFPSLLFLIIFFSSIYFFFFLISYNIYLIKSLHR